MNAAASKPELEPTFREVRTSDLGFITASWVDSFRDGCLRDLQPEIRSRAYFVGQRTLIDELLRRPGCRGVVAAAPEYDEAILGWAIAEPPDALHYVYVKDLFRHLGLARALIAQLHLSPKAFAYTHITRRGRELLEHYPHGQFNPYVLLRSYR